MEKEVRQLLEEKYHGVKTEEFYEDERRLAFGEPPAYVIGFQPFLGLTVWLDSHPLIPRTETEWWTNELLQKLSSEHHIHDPHFLDLCAGSGAIGCAALQLLPKNWQVYFGELDPAHASTIQKNIRENGLDENRATIKIGDLFAPFQELRFDCIAVNPPYIPQNRTLPESVAHYEPPLALFSGNDGLSLIRRIATDAKNFLTEHGVLLVECDSPHTEESKTIFEEAGFTSVIHNDQFSMPRVVVSYR